MSSVIDTIKSQIKTNPIVLYMKGSPSAPMCGFSGRVVEILKTYGIAYSYIDVLENPDIRQQLPSFSHWPTFPQLFVNQELVGGCDIIVQLNDQDELESILKPSA